MLLQAWRAARAKAAAPKWEAVTVFHEHEQKHRWSVRWSARDDNGNWLYIGHYESWGAADRAAQTYNVCRELPTQHPMWNRAAYGIIIGKSVRAGLTQSQDLTLRNDSRVTVMQPNGKGGRGIV